MGRIVIVLLAVIGPYLLSTPSLGQPVRTITCKTQSCGVTQAYLLKDDFSLPTLVVIDSALVRNNTVAFKIADLEPALYYIQFDEQDYKTGFFLDTDIALLLEDDNCYQVEALNSALTREWTAFKQDIVSPFMDQSQANMATILQVDDDSSSVKVDSLYQARVLIYQHYAEAVASYIARKRSSFLTLYLIKWYSKELATLSQDYPKRMLDSLDSSLKSTKTYALMQAKL